MDWDIFLRVMHIFGDAEHGELMLSLAIANMDLERSGQPQPREQWSALQQCPHMEKLRQKYRQGERYPLYSLLTTHVDCKATDLPDKLYAMQGISNDPQALEVDYAKENTVSRVYTQLAVYCLRRNDLLGVLQRAGTGWTGVIWSASSPERKPCVQL
jgi:hypothetical protein